MATKNQLQKALDECRANRTTDKATISKQADEIAGLKLALADCQGEPEPPPTPPPTGQPKFYAPTALWNTRRPSKPIAANSAALVETLHQTKGGQDAAKTYVRMGSFDGYGHPIFYAKSTDPEFVIDTTESWSTTDGQRFRVPADAKQAVGTDGHLTVIQPDGMEYDFWQVRNIDRTAKKVTASVGGKLWIDGDATGGQSSAMGHGLPAGVIMADELKAGRIPHALFFVSTHTNGNKVNGAMSRGSVAAGNYPAMGQRFFLEMSADQINAFASKPWQRAILTAGVEYGWIVGDTGGGFFKADTSQAMHDLGKELGLPLWDGHYLFDCPVPWDKLRAEAA